MTRLLALATLFGMLVARPARAEMPRPPPRPKPKSPDLPCIPKVVAENEAWMARQKAHPTKSKVAKQPPRPLERMTVPEMVAAKVSDPELAGEVVKRAWKNEAASRPAGTLAALELLRMEVDHGGLSEFFEYAGGNKSPEVLEALKAIESPPLVHLFQCALTAFDGNQAPRDRDARTKQLEAYGTGEYTMFEKLDSAFHAYDPEWTRAEASFIRRNAKQLDLPSRAP